MLKVSKQDWDSWRLSRSFFLSFISFAMSVVVIVILAQDVLKVSYLSKPCFDIIPSKAEDNSPAFRSNWGILESLWELRNYPDYYIEKKLFHSDFY